MHISVNSTTIQLRCLSTCALERSWDQLRCVQSLRWRLTLSSRVQQVWPDRFPGFSVMKKWIYTGAWGAHALDKAGRQFIQSVACMFTSEPYLTKTTVNLLFWSTARLRKRGKTVTSMCGDLIWGHALTKMTVLRVASKYCMERRVCAFTRDLGTVA